MTWDEIVDVCRRVEKREPVRFREILDVLVECRPVDRRYASYLPHIYPIYRHWGACGRPIELEW